MVRRHFSFKIGIFIPFLCILLMSHNTFAVVTADANRFLFAASLQYNTSPSWSSPQRYDEYVPYAELSAVQMNTYPTAAPTGNYVNINGKMNVSLVDINSAHSSYPYTQDLWDLTVICGWGGQTLITDGASVSYSVGTWQGIVNGSQGKVKYIDLTFQFSGHFPQGYSGIGTNQLMSCAVRRKTPRSGGYYEPFAVGQLNSTYAYSNNTAYNGYLSVETSNDAEIQAIVGIQNAVNTQTSVIIEHNAKEDQAVDNIENQSPSDINNASNAATTNLIGILSNFVSQLSSFSATNCNVTIPFPVFLGGNKIVNICQNKDKAGDLISIIGSLILIGFYIPLAIVLLKMIYGEIRSFTNG